MGPDSEVSFERTFTPAVEKMLQLAAFTNEDAGARGYPEGNAAFAAGEAAMYLQGPWAIGEIAKANPDTQGRQLRAAGDRGPARTPSAASTWTWRCGSPKQAQATGGGARSSWPTCCTPRCRTSTTWTTSPTPRSRTPRAVQDERIAGLGALRPRRPVLPGGRHLHPASHPAAQLPAGAGPRRQRRVLRAKLDKDWRRLAQRTA